MAKVSSVAPLPLPLTRSCPGVRFAIYTAESPTTCAGYPASAKHEVVDADTFASWGVDYLKVFDLSATVG